MTRKVSPTLLVEWAPGCVRALDPASGEIQEAADLAALGPLAQRHRRAVIGIARSQVFLRLLRLPKASPEDLRRIVSVQLGQLFPLPADELAFDVAATGDRSPEGWLTLVAAVRSSDLRRLAEELRSAGLGAARVLPMAMIAPLLAARGSRPDALVLTDSATGLAIDLVQGGVLRMSRTVPAGSDPKAEIERTLAAIGADDLPVLRAGAAGPREPLELLAEADHIRLELPEERLRAAHRHAAVRARLAGVMAAAAVFLAAFAWMDHSGAAGVVSKAEAAMSTDLSKLRSAQARESARLQEGAASQAVLTSAFEPAQPVSDVTNLLADRLPSGAWLTGLTVDRGKPVVFRGTATRSAAVAELVAALQGTARLADVRLVSANTARIGQAPIVQFSVSAEVVGNDPPPTPTKTAQARRKQTGGGNTAEEGGQR